MPDPFVKTIKNRLNEIPPAIKSFAIRAIVFFVAWKVLYYFVFIPTQQPDRWLTQVTAKASAKTLSSFRNDGTYKVEEVFDKQGGIDGGSNLVYKSVIIRDDKKVMGVANACNALELMVLYGLFLFCIPTTFKRTLLFLSIGLGMIFLLNIARCVLISNINLNGHVRLADMAHHYIFKLFMYLLIFGAWVWYCKKLSIEKA